jgi:hypothetical protein
MLQINEKSGHEFSVEFKDADGVPTQPTTAHWRLDCETTRKALQDDTALTVIASTDDNGITHYRATVEVPGSLNAIQNNRNAREMKKLLVIADKDSAREYSLEVTYAVVNLRGRS